MAIGSPPITWDLKHTGELFVYIDTSLANPSGNTGVVVCMYDNQPSQAERLDLEERYSSLQEENAAKTRKLKRAVQLLNSAKAELADQQREQQREMEGILDSVRALKREIQLADLVLDSYIPKEYQVQSLPKVSFVF